MKKIMMALLLVGIACLSSAQGLETEEFHLLDAEARPVVALHVGHAATVDMGAPAYRVQGDDCHDSLSACYFLPDADATELYWLFGRIMRDAGFEFDYEVAGLLQVWNPYPGVRNGLPVTAHFHQMANGVFLTLSW